MYARKYYFFYFHYISSFIPLKYIVLLRCCFFVLIENSLFHFHFFTFFQIYFVLCRVKEHITLL